MNAKEKLTLALDVSTLDEALQLVEQTKEYVGYYKVGKEILNAVGLPTVLKALKELGVKVFVDVKEMDIPNTVKNAVLAAVRCGADIVNIHASGGFEMMAETVSCAKKLNPDVKIIAVSILTSLDDEDMQEIGYLYSAEAMVLKLASLADDAGCDGLVCSPKELGMVRMAMDDGAFIITPGIRPAWDTKLGDQKRVMTPSEAVFNGCSTMVVGRSITKNSKHNPHDAAKLVFEEIQDALTRPHLMKPTVNLEDLLVDHLLKANVVKTGSFTLKSGAKSPIYINVRDLATDYNALSFVALVMSWAMPSGDYRVGGVPMGALSIANMLAFSTRKKILTLRAEAKDHGLVGTKTVEHFEKGETVLVVEDVATSGGSIKEAVDKYRSLGLNVSDAFVVVDREQGAKEMLKEIGVELHSLITLSQIVEALVNRDDISDELKQELLSL